MCATACMLWQMGTCTGERHFPEHGMPSPRFTHRGMSKTWNPPRSTAWTCRRQNGEMNNEDEAGRRRPDILEACHLQTLETKHGRCEGHYCFAGCDSRRGCGGGGGGGLARRGQEILAASPEYARFLARPRARICRSHHALSLRTNSAI